MQSTLYRMDGDNRTRTYDPLHVKQMLSQLSYISIKNIISEKGLFDKSFSSIYEKFIMKYE